MYNLEWANENSERKFPFIHTASLRDKTKRYTLPNSVIVDTLLALTEDYNLPFFLSNITYSPKILSVTISMATGKVALVGSINNPDPLAKNFTLELNGEEKYLGSYGKIIIGSLENLLEGSFDFFAVDSFFEPCRVIKLSRGISAINGITNGNVILTEGANTEILVNGRKIEINAIDAKCQCDTCQCIKTINGIPPLGNNFKITGVGCVQINPTENGIEIVNTCEESCCGCDEINAIVQQLQELQSRIIALESA